MNYFELINSCLMELNFNRLSSFESLTKTDHEKIKVLLNRVNSEICLSDDWWFRERKTGLSVRAGEIEHTNTIPGRITGIVIDNIEFNYDPEFEKFYQNRFSAHRYSLYNDKILFPALDIDKTAIVLYLTNNFAVGSDLSEKCSMVLEDDTSVIPATFQESILIYGTCMRFKAMPNNPKYQHWLAEYTKALKNLRSQGGRAVFESPRVVINKGEIRMPNQNCF